MKAMVLLDGEEYLTGEEAAAQLGVKRETLYAYVQNDVTKRRPTVELALKLFCATPEEQLALAEIDADAIAKAARELVSNSSSAAAGQK